MEDAAGCADCCWYNDKEAGRDETDDQEEALAYPPPAQAPVATLAVAEETPLGTAVRPRTSFVAAEAAAAAAIAAAAAA